MIGIILDELTGRLQDVYQGRRLVYLLKADQITHLFYIGLKIKSDTPRMYHIFFTGWEELYPPGVLCFRR